MSKYQICVSGAAAGDTVESSHMLAYALGVAIAEQGHTLLTGATSGLPQYAARGAKDQGGLSVGFSPAGSIREHVKSYRLPVKEFDYINFTNMDYVGRDTYLVRSSDAVITVGGRSGSLHEFSTAIESHKICGILLGSGGVADFIPTLLDKIQIHAKKDDIIFDTDPARLIKTIIARLDKEYADFKDEIKSLEDRPKKSLRG
ncbi:MAG TPA: hypothetical protein VLA77_02920 [Candidatus Saccharimonadales bacterium]|nr:hypothetical protein [Candidatus Saccharimonadales bacterium]